MDKFLSISINIAISMFSVRYAIKSINRRKKKNFATVLAVALGVTLLMNMNTRSKDMTEALASSWWQFIGDARGRDRLL